MWETTCRYIINISLCFTAVVHQLINYIPGNDVGIYHTVGLDLVFVWVHESTLFWG
jgi:hypothetical protein